MAGIMQMVSNNVAPPRPPYTWYEAFGTTVAISTTQYVGATKIYAYSSTYDVPSYQNAVIQVNDVEIVNTANRGHTMAVLSPGGVTVSINWYDTYIDPAQLTALANALNGVASGNRVVLVVYDASALNATVRSAINTGYGSTNTNTWTAQRISHILVGIKS
ncbi:Interleukin-like EMT inducer [uncultured Caudovirales phage]|uniref:Interleukin-like EMT inducer n=1 Tax=uncultured Caudovirales phage TaxID=2100421 RepID=A0A6J5LYU8_9CAUD|nr:Interleukin-like EMT inducer [uncultured Caudovirales phage]